MYFVVNCLLVSDFDVGGCKNGLGSCVLRLCWNCKGCCKVCIEIKCFDFKVFGEVECIDLEIELFLIICR